MPRDASGTKARLLDAAERLFADRGIDAVTTREIVEAADQRNTSAVSYHFGSREGLLVTLLLDRDAPVDEARGRHLAALGADADTRDLIRALVVPYAECLHTPRGRDYLRIVAQLRGDFANWRRGTEDVQVNLGVALGALEERPAELPLEVRRERVVALIMLMTASAAERARRLEAGRTPALGHDEWVEELVAMLAGIVEAPSTVPVRPH